MMKSFFLQLIVVLLIAVVLVSCSTSGPAGLFGKKSPHDSYADKLKSAGLDKTAIGNKWFAAANSSLTSPLQVSVPYRETGYFAADEPRAAGLLFEGQRGEKLQIELTKKPLQGFEVFVDLWQAPLSVGEEPKLLLSLDSTGKAAYDVDENVKLLVRLQPELLASGEYTLSISSGPSLAFPVSPKAKSNIGSFWGAGRDAGARKHEGIDIFAPRNTPLVAAADGVITNVTENNLGGRVVFLRPNNKNFTLYYAHLEKQLVQPGQTVSVGDTIGLVGNSGNARTTSTHLHFGIYTNGGAIDPLPFVQKEFKSPPTIAAPTNVIGALVRSTIDGELLSQPLGNARSLAVVSKNTLLKIEAATGNFYKALLPDGSSGFIAANRVDKLDAPIKRIDTRANLPLLNEPTENAATITQLLPGDKVSVLALFNNYYFVRKGSGINGWVNKTAL